MYADIFTAPDWDLIGLSILQTATIYAFLLFGLKLVGRRVFAQRSPQDLIIIVLVAEACDIGLAPEDAGYWGTIASVTTLFILGYLTERIGIIRRLMDDKPITLYKNGQLDRKALFKTMVDEEDLDEAARQKEKDSYTEFESVVLEGDGRISVVGEKS